MASYYQTKKTIQLKGGHVCSKCKSVILTDFEFYSLANSRWSQKKAQAGAEAAAEKGLKALSEFHEKPFLTTMVSEERTYSLVSGFGLERLSHACPYCGHRERWQMSSALAGACRIDPVSGVHLVTDVPEESRLVALTSKEALDAWRVKIMDGNVLSMKQHWEEHADEAESIRGQIQALEEQIESLNAEKTTVWEKSKALSGKIADKETQVKGYSLFSAERKAAKAELKELKKQHSAQYTADFEREKNLISTVNDLKKQVKELKIGNPGVLGTVEMVTPNDAPYCQAVRPC